MAGNVLTQVGPVARKVLRLALDLALKLTDRSRGHAAPRPFEHTASLQDGTRLRRVRVVRDYAMFDRREAPQFYPDVNKGP
jgi:hypothetical protein